MARGAWDLEIRIPGWSTLHTAASEEHLRDPCVKRVEQLFEDDRIRIPPRRLAALREAIHRERFFELRDSYGGLVIDGPERRIEVREGNSFKKMTIYSTSPDMRISDSEREEIGRALRVWIAIRDCFEAPGAMDSRPEDREFLSSAARRGK
jgi:hypothetical protein